MNLKLNNLKIYKGRKKEYIKANNSLINNAKNFYKGREKIIEGVKKEIFPFESDDDDDDDDDDDEDEKPKQQQISKKSVETDVNAFNEWINKEETGINMELFRKRFDFQRPSSMAKYLYKANDRKENNKLVSVINSGLKDFKERN